MSSLAYAPYDEQSSNNVFDPIEEKRQAQSRNKTIKKKPSENVQKLMQTISAYDNTDSEDNLLGDFNPPPKAELSKVKDTTVMNSSPLLMPTPSPSPSPMTAAAQLNASASASSLQDEGANMYRPTQAAAASSLTNIMPNTFSNDYTQQYVPYYNQLNQLHYSGNGGGGGNKDLLLEKLNYMIHLLEEQQDQKTGHVMEEIILYSFLGIFLIFIVDSFARAGKYVR